MVPGGEIRVKLAEGPLVEGGNTLLSKELAEAHEDVVGGDQLVHKLAVLGVWIVLLIEYWLLYINNVNA